VTNATVSLSVPGMAAVQYALEYQYDAAGNVGSILKADGRWRPREERDKVSGLLLGHQKQV